MTTAIILSTALLILMVLMSIREYEISNRKVSKISLLARKLDPLCASGIKMMVQIFYTCTGMFRVVVREYIVPLIHNVAKHLHFHAQTAIKHTYKHIKGHRRLREGASVNFFLHSLGEHKKLHSHHSKK